MDCVQFVIDRLIEYAVSCDLYIDDYMVVYICTKREGVLVGGADCVGDIGQILWDCGISFFLFFQRPLAFCGLFSFLVVGLGAIAHVGRGYGLWLAVLWGVVGNTST